MSDEPVMDAYELFREGQRRLRKGEAAQATVPLEKAKRMEPAKASIREALGIAYFRIARWAEAEAEFRMVLELSPVDDYAHYALGRALEQQGKADEALGHFRLASTMRPAVKHYANRAWTLDEEESDETRSRN